MVLFYRGRRSWVRRITPILAMSPAILSVLVVYVGCLVWTVNMSFTASKSVPDMTYVGLTNWLRLFADYRWRGAMNHMFVFGALYISGCLVLGYVLAILLDQRVKGENFFRTVFLCPHAMSFIVTGQVWQWFLNPEFGLQRSVRDLGWGGFTFDWLASSRMAIYTLVIAGVWQGVGMVMVLMLAGLRGIDDDLWKAARVDGIPMWRTYVSVILPMLMPPILTSVVLLGVGAVKNYDLVVAMTGGGPGLSTDVPSKFVMEYLLERGNIAFATAGATFMLATTLCIGAPFLLWQALRQRRARRL